MAFPDETTTGVPSGTSLTRYTGTLHITTDNAVIDARDIVGDVIVDAKNVTIKNSKITSTGDFTAIRVTEGATGFKLINSEVISDGTTQNGVFGYGTFQGNDIHGFENALNIWEASLIEGNYLHGMDGSAEAHFDTIEINEGSNITIRGNTIVNEHGQTSAIMMDNWAGGLSNITIDGNRLEGGGYTVYLDDTFGGGAVDDGSIRITNNQVGGGFYGDFSLYGNNPVMSGNVGLDETPPTSEPSPGLVERIGTAASDVLPLSGQSSSGNETYKGMGGNDVLRGGAGADKLDGGTGSDTATYSGSSAAVTVDLLYNEASGGHAAGDTFVSIENLTGSRFTDTLRGNAGNNVLHDGGPGTGDTLLGRAGNDTYRVFNSSDVIFESSSQGTADRVVAAVDYKLGTGVYVEAMSTNGSTGKAAIDLTGNALKQTITGNAGANVLRDGGGAGDHLTGLGGSDTYKIYSASTTITEAIGQGKDRVMAGVDYKLGAGDDIEILATNGTRGRNPIDLTGNEQSQLVIGNNGANRIDGKGDADVLKGLGGADTFVFSSALGGGNVDKIVDFNTAADRIALDNAVFKALSATGTLSASAFWSNNTGAAHDASDRVIYETDTGRVFYDADGAGGAAGIHFATLTGGLNLTNADFTIV